MFHFRSANPARQTCNRRLLQTVVLLLGITGYTKGLQPFSSLTRRDATFAAGGGVAAAYFYAKALESLFNPPIVYPSLHEDKLRRVLRITLESGSPVQPASSYTLAKDTASMRILEVGIGSAARLIRRDLYDFGVTNSTNINMIGLDLNIPTSNDVLKDIALHTPPLLSLELQQGSITEKTSFPDGYFDAVVCCLTLCSVSDPDAALREMKRLVRPKGGSFGFCEHVAAPDGSFFGKQQLLLDPLQQRLADNCHLHRKTQDTIRAVFGNDAEYLFQSDFFVNSMWPVSFQSCGVLQMK